MWIRLLLANLSKGANNGNEVTSLLFILMMMLFEKGFPYFNPHAVTQVTEQFLLVQDQIWKIDANINTLMVNGPKEANVKWVKGSGGGNEHGDAIQPVSLRYTFLK